MNGFVEEQQREDLQDQHPSGSKVTIRVNANTKFQRIAGNFSGLRQGMAVEVEAQSTSSGLLAKHVEPKESGGGGADDPPNHG